MRSLLLAPEPFLPAQSGLPLRVLHLARALAREVELDVAVISEHSAPVAGELFRVSHLAGDWGRAGAIVRAAWQPWPVAQIRSRALAQRVRAADWDLVEAHTLPMMRYVSGARPSVFDVHDVMTDVTQTIRKVDSRQAMGPIWGYETLKTRRFEGAAVRRATAVTVPSDDDAELVERIGARRVVVVPNGIDVEATPHHLPPTGNRLTFVAYFAWRPNVEAALELCDEILPRVRARVPSAALTLVGAAAPTELAARAGPGVELTGRVDDVLPHLRAARVTVMPLRAGGGTRLKVLEALASGDPVVATPFAVRGLGVRHGVHALIAESSSDLAELAITVIESDELAISLSRAGRELVQRYAWPEVARPLVELHRELGERSAKR